MGAPIPVGSKERPGPAWFGPGGPTLDFPRQNRASGSGPALGRAGQNPRKRVIQTPKRHREPPAPLTRSPPAAPPEEAVIGNAKRIVAAESTRQHRSGPENVPGHDEYPSTGPDFRLKSGPVRGQDATGTRCHAVEEPFRIVTSTHTHPYHCTAPTDASPHADLVSETRGDSRPEQCPNIIHPHTDIHHTTT